jgi:hypothetical protein
MNRSYLLNVLAISLLAGLGACGSQPLPPPVAPPPVHTGPIPPANIPFPTNGDFFAQQMANFQATFGNVILEAPVTLNGVTIVAGSTPWAVIGEQIKTMVSCGPCLVQVPQYFSAQANISVFARLDWTQVDMSLKPVRNNWSLTAVRFERLDPRFRYSFMSVWNMVVGSTYQYYARGWYQGSSVPYYFGQGYYYGGADYYESDSYVNAGLSYSGSGISIDFNLLKAF